MSSWLILNLITTVFVLVSTQRFDSAEVFRVKPQNEDQVDFMKNLANIVKVDFWHPDSAMHIVRQMEVDFRVSGDQAEKVRSLMEQNGLHYEVLFQNLQEDLEKQWGDRNSTGKYSYTSYNDWSKISAWTARIQRKNPRLVSRIQIGNTFENRPIYVLKVGKQKHAKQAIFMDCGFHAREWISPAFCQWFVKEATMTYGKDRDMTDVLDNMNFYIVPLVNIDGYIWSWTQDRFWRKNRSNSSDSVCVGVDLNRNFDMQWGTIDGSKEPCEETYCGTSPESEPETKAIAEFIRNHLSSIKAYLTIHSYSQMLLYPYGYTYEKAPDDAELKKLAKGVVEVIASLYGKHYIYGPSATTIYPSSGCSDDWAYKQGIKYSFTFELRDKGRHGFLLPESEIKPTCQEITLAVKLIANYILRQAS